MTKDQIQARIDELMRFGREAESRIHAINGALQECNYWMSQLEQGAEPEVKTQNEG
jgi:hypothetical protein